MKNTEIPKQRDVVRRASLCLFFLLLVGSLVSAQDVTIPTITEPVNDFTNTLNPEQILSLRRSIMQFEDSTSNQIVILMIPTLGMNEIRDFGTRFLEQNKIGKKGRDNGILILVAKDDKKISIEVGYGLEGVLTDALSDQIIRNRIRPYFREQDYYGGLVVAVESIIAVTKGEYKGEKKNKRDSSWGGFLIVLLVIGISIISSIRNRQYGITSRGYRSNNNWWWGGDGFGSGGFGGGSFGGGGGGGSWSGGGGSFGGGGSSGSW